ncbi:hypothetical protein SELMODRAFT_410298 [Selaginella moellendorffii]|uniref:AMP-dependent synthetase/ligase domain-containing protein n=1 Tax=Selaginella moellendorffii TaxID=88036 RepID=D8REB0_SELML|nr:hypothetical protein SELMODRAFT_410298 [Selaginella moellendorffii]
MPNLRPDTRYSYRYGSDNSGWSNLKTFTTPPAGGPYCTKFLIFGDMGKAERDDSLEHYIQPGALQVIDAMAKEPLSGICKSFSWKMSANDKLFSRIKNSLPPNKVIAKGIFATIAEHNVTNFCSAPTVLNTIISVATGSTFLRLQHRQVRIMTTGAAPPAAVLAKIEALGFHVTHVYRLTETYGPCTVLNSETLEPVAKDGVTIGKVCMRGNMVFRGYLNNPEATLESFRGGWFHSGDLAVWHPDGYIEIKDRAKNITISGGENISSLEVGASCTAVLEAAVVARPDEKWGESPCAFVSLKHGMRSKEEEILSFCRQRLPEFMVPKSVIILVALDKTATGKIQKQVLHNKARALGSIKQISKL